MFTSVIAILGIVIRTSVKFGRFMEQFEELKQKVRIHDQLLGIPLGAEHHTAAKAAHGE